MVKFYTFEKTIKPFIDSEKLENRTYYALEIGNNRILLSYPRIQPFNEFRFNDMKDAIHFYYDVDIQQKEHNGDGWINIVSEGIYEFPCVQALFEVIDELKKCDLSSDAGRREYLYDSLEHAPSKTNFEAQKEISLSQILGEEEYSVTKVYRFIKNNYNPETDDFEDSKYTWYNIYFGISVNSSDNNTVGFKANQINEEEIEEVYKWSKGFMEYAINSEKQSLEEYYDEIEQGKTREGFNYYNALIKVYAFLRKENKKEKCIEMIAKLEDKASGLIEDFALKIENNKPVKYEDYINEGVEK